MVDVRKGRVQDFGQNRLVSRVIISCTIKKNNYKLFPHAMPKIQIPKNDGSVEDTEVNRKHNFKRTLSYSLSHVPLSTCNPDRTRRLYQRRTGLFKSMQLL